MDMEKLGEDLARAGAGKPVVLLADDAYLICFLKLVAKCNELQERVETLETEGNLNKEAMYDADT